MYTRQPDDEQPAERIEQLVVNLVNELGSLGERSFDVVKNVARSLGLNRVAESQVIVGGTNGKGTTVSYLQQLLTQSGYRVGTTTSPHVSSYLERIAIDGKPVSAGECMTAVDYVKTKMQDIPLTYFDITTLTAFRIFEQQNVDVLIAEVGLGGRLDCANVLDSDLSVVTNVGLDHQDRLGDTIELISREKLGIARSNIPLLFGGSQCNQTVDEVAQKIGAPLLRRYGNFGISTMGDAFYTKSGKQYGCELPRGSCIDEDGLTLALQSVALLKRDVEISRLDLANLRRPPGRTEHISYCGRTWILDIAHNAAATYYLRRTLATGGVHECVGLFGCFKDKDIEAIGREMQRKETSGPMAAFKKLVIVPTSGNRGSSAAETATRLRLSCSSEIDITESIDDAIHTAIPNHPSLPVVVFGSVEIVSKVRSFLKENNPIGVAS